MFAYLVLKHLPRARSTKNPLSCLLLDQAIVVCWPRCRPLATDVAAASAAAVAAAADTAVAGDSFLGRAAYPFNHPPTLERGARERKQNAPKGKRQGLWMEREREEKEYGRKICFQLSCRPRKGIHFAPLSVKGNSIPCAVIVIVGRTTRLLVVSDWFSLGARPRRGITDQTIRVHYQSDFIPASVDVIVPCRRRYVFGSTGRLNADAVRDTCRPSSAMALAVDGSHGRGTAASRRRVYGATPPNCRTDE